jgi:hypothetical protein
VFRLLLEGRPAPDAGGRPSTNTHKAEHGFS